MINIIIKVQILILSFVLIFSGLFAQEEKITNLLEIIEGETLYKYVDTLASEEFEGRLTGHSGYDMSAEWVIKKLKEWDVQPLGAYGSYLQEFAHPYLDVYEGCEVNIQRETKDSTYFHKYEYVEEFIPGSTSGDGEITAEVVYAGYGISAEELGYDDYANIDVTGKIVVLEREVPITTSDEEFIVWRDYSFHQYKLKNAVDHGASGMLYNYHIGNPNNDYSEGFVFSHIGDKVMADIFHKTGKKPEKVVKKINKKRSPQSFNTGKIVQIKNNTRYYPEGIGSNVIGYIEGSDPVLKNEFIMVGGHLDHLGKCYTTMPGAHDNASAVSVAMGIAKALSESDIELKRSVAFFFSGAEEAALKGVQYFLKNPTIDLNNIKGYINMDGVGIGDGVWIGFAENYPKLYSYLVNANETYVHTNFKPDYSSNISRPRLDAAFFDWYGIPVLSLSSTATDDSYANYRYHTPYDNISNINPEILEDITELVIISIINMANEETLEFKRGEIKKEFID